MISTVREATAADRPALVDLWVDAWTAAMPEIDFEARRAWFVGHLEQLASTGALVLVAEPQGASPHGFITVDPVSCDVDQLAIAQRSQRTGLATQLMGAAKQLSPTGLGLSVNSNNCRAIAFYKREGFCIVGEGVNPRSGLPVLRMRWAGIGDPGPK